MDRNDDVIELGTATVETKGASGIYSDDVLLQQTPGLADD